MKPKCQTCYHYADHDGYAPDDCARPSYDPKDFLHDNGPDGAPNRPLPLEGVCLGYRDRNMTYRIRRSKSLLNTALDSLKEMTPSDIRHLRRKIEEIL